MSSQGNVAARIDGETILASYENEANMVYFTNRSGGSLSTGAVVVVDSANDKAFKTTTTQDDQTVLGVIPQLDDVNGAASDQTIANNAAGYVQFAGFISKLNVQGNVTRGNYLRCSTTAGRAENAGSTPTKGSFAIAVTGYAGGGAGQVQAVLIVSGNPSDYLANKSAAGESIQRGADAKSNVAGTNSPISISQNGPYTVTFPVAFNSTPRLLTTLSNGGYVYTHFVSPLQSTTGFSYYILAAAGGTLGWSLEWLAIGS